MDTKKINLDGLKNVLSPKEMKNVKGGSGRCSGSGNCGNGPCHDDYYGVDGTCMEGSVGDRPMCICVAKK